MRTRPNQGDVIVTSGIPVTVGPVVRAELAPSTLMVGGAIPTPMTKSRPVRYGESETIPQRLDRLIATARAVAAALHAAKKAP